MKRLLYFKQILIAAFVCRSKCTIHGAVAPKINIVFILQSRCNYNLKVRRSLFKHLIAAFRDTNKQALDTVEKSYRIKTVFTFSTRNPTFGGEKRKEIKKM